MPIIENNGHRKVSVMLLKADGISMQSLEIIQNTQSPLSENTP